MASVRRSGSARLAVVVALAVVSIGACTAGSSVAPVAPSSPSAASATPAASAPASAAPPASAATDGVDPTAAMESVIADLMAAIGNPDTGSTSEAMQAFEAGLASGDATVIASTSEVVLGHLANGRATIAATAGSGCASFCPEWDQMLSGIADAVVAMRDAGIAGDRAAVEAGRTRIGEALQDHFWQGIRGNDAELNVVHLRDGRVANASRMRWSTRPEAAFDGVEDTAWTTGDAAPPQWIQVDLGVAATVDSIRALTFQDAAGSSDHRVTVCGVDGVEREFARFTGVTADRQWLEHRPADPAPDVRVVRVTTLAAPATIGWREIEVGLASGAVPSPSASVDTPALCGVADLTSGASVTGEPSPSGHEPALAIDDDPATGWDPGPSGSIRITLAGAAVVSEIRLLAGDPAGGAVDYLFLAVLPGNERVLIGKLSGPAAPGAWRSVVNTSPTITFAELEVLVRAASTAPEVLEIEVIGSALR